MIANVLKVFGPNAIGLILLVGTLESIERPICPVNVCLFQVAYRIVPEGILLIVSELSQEVRVSQSSYHGLTVVQLLFEGLVRNTPAGKRPREGVEMSRKYEFIGNCKLKRKFCHLSEVKLIVNTAYNDEPVRCDFEGFISAYFGGSSPVC